MDRLQELAVLVAIADHGSLAVAARRLRRSAPAITRALAALESRIGARLVERTTRKLSLTDAGRALTERSRALLNEYDAALGGAADQPARGWVRVTAPVQFGRRHIAPLVTRFLDAYPQIQVELVLSDRNLNLIEEELDVAVRIGPLADSSLLARRVGQVTRVVVASPDYLARRGTPVRPADLSAHDTIFNTFRGGGLEWRFGSPKRPTVVRLAPRLLVNEVEAQLIAVRAGHGIARVLSYQVIDDLSSGRLTRLLEKHEPPPLPVQLVARSGTHMPPKIRAVLDHFAAALIKLRVIQTTV